jgi:hypothetical protein
MVNILELVLGVDPAVDPDIAGVTTCGDRERLRQIDRRRTGEQSADSIPRPERLEDGDATDDGEDAQGDEEEGSHGGDHSGPSVEGRLAAWRATKDPKEPTRGVGVDAIAAVSLRSAPPG